MLKRLRRIRRENGLTQAEVARALGTTQAYVSKSENGERRLDAVELYDLARIYGTPLETLLPASNVRRLAPGEARPNQVAEQPARPKSDAGPKAQSTRGSRPARRSKPGRASNPAQPSKPK
jgi:transcriptional regulator with XRE-family HTH domain